MIFGIVLSFVVVIIVCAEIRKWLIKRKLRYFVSPKQLPIIGVAGRFFGKPNEKTIEIILEMYNEVGTSPIQVWLGPILAVGVAEPKDIEIILTNENCLNKPYFYEHLHCKSSIIATERDVWKPDRRAMNTAFDVKTLQSYVPLLNEKSGILVKRMQSHVNTAANLYRLIFMGTMDSIARTTMGTEANLQSKRGEYFAKIFRQIMENIQYRATRIWLRWDFIYSLSKVGRDEKHPLNIGNSIIQESYLAKKNELKQKKKRHQYNEPFTRNVMEKCIQLEEDGIYNHENLMDQLRLVIFAGIDTLSTTVYSTLLMLAINQKHQELVIDELRTIFDTADCDVTQSHLIRMKYTERAIKESHRLLTPVPFIGRKTTADIDLPKGTIPKNTIIVINIMHLHLNANIWGENVNEFDPDRFLPENIAKRPPFSYIPFSAGPRNCVGMKYAMISAKITLAHLLRRYKFTTDLGFDDIRLKLHLVLEIINENPLRIEERHFDVQKKKTLLN